MSTENSEWAHSLSYAEWEAEENVRVALAAEKLREAAARAIEPIVYGALYRDCISDHNIAVTCQRSREIIDAIWPILLRGGQA